MISDRSRPAARFSHAGEVDGRVMLTGQMPTDSAAPDAPLPERAAAQAQRVMERLRGILQGAGLDQPNVVQMRAYSTEFDRDCAVLNGTYRSFFPPDRLPARTTIGVVGLADSALVEIDCLTRRP
ncbi:MAG TPA: RidA family protein [Roseibacterium sp.]|nr:RidA family protein [Roseibacterium sp.]